MADATQAIVIADDDPAIRRLFGKALGRAGFDILNAADGAIALDLAFHRPVDLMILDLDMPNVSGLEVIAKLRQRSETAMLPILIVTGRGDDQGVIDGLGAGADDFLTKPARLDELVARVHARLRTSDAWTRTVEADLRSRATIVSALGQVAITEDPQDVAEGVVRQLGKWSDLDLVAVLEVLDGQHLRPLASYSRTGGVERPGLPVTSTEASRLLTRTLGGPWAERVPASDSSEASLFVRHRLAAVAVAPIHSLDRLLGILVLGRAAAAGSPARTELARLLGSAIDYASVMGIAVRTSFGSHHDEEVTRSRLRGILEGRAFHPVFQPIVEIPSRDTVGYEALTRFTDGTPPAERFGEAADAGLGLQYEVAAIRAAVAAATDLPPGPFLTLNVSPHLVIESTMLREVISDVRRPVVLEITEHAVIDDYSALRSAMLDIPNVRYAVDDAGAGYASFRHILELAPTYAKLDVTIIRAIERDPMRQALVMGLDHFALRTRCQLIAEGVETEDEEETLIGLGVQLAQGYLFGRPERAG
jgi:EAL domain-containing protein (putative c-di-GMP-specific phosphodiesterase class I)/DNA-binding response OmpR family regulator